MTLTTHARPHESAAAPPSPQPLAALDSRVPLTRVSLAYLAQRINLYLRFGHPARTVQLDRWRRCTRRPTAKRSMR